MTSPGRLLAPAKNRLRLGLGAAVVLIIVGLGVAVLVSTLGSHGSTRAFATDTAPSRPSSAAASPGVGKADGVQIYVHVVGAVEHPGLFALRDGDRVVWKAVHVQPRMARSLRAGTFLFLRALVNVMVRR